MQRGGDEIQSQGRQQQAQDNHCRRRTSATTPATTKSGENVLPNSARRRDSRHRAGMGFQEPRGNFSGCPMGGNVLAQSVSSMLCWFVSPTEYLLTNSTRTKLATERRCRRPTGSNPRRPNRTNCETGGAPRRIGRLDHVCRGFRASFVAGVNARRCFNLLRSACSKNWCRCSTLGEFAVRSTSRTYSFSSGIA